MKPRRPIPERVMSCVVCGARNECLKASHLWGVRRDKTRLRQVVDEVRYNRRLLQTAELEQGRRAHLSLETARRVEKDLEVIFRRINAREGGFFMTATFCSPTFGGIRCQPDAIYVESEGSTLRLLVIEDKTSNQARYYTQLYAEAVVLTDRSCLIAPAFEMDHLGIGGRLDQGREPFFSRMIGFDTFIVDASLNPYRSPEGPLDRPLPPLHFSVNFHMLPGIERKYFVVTQSKKAILSALRHPQRIGEEVGPQMKFTKKGKELRLYVPKTGR